MNEEWVVKALWEGKYGESAWMFVGESPRRPGQATLIAHRGNAFRFESEISAMERGYHYRDVLRIYREFEVEKIAKPVSFKTDADRAADDAAANDRN